MNFHNSEEVIRFAFTVFAKSILNTTTFGESIPTTGDVTTPQDNHAQCILIITAMANRLSEKEMTFVYSRFSGDPETIRFSLRALAYLYAGAELRIDNKLAHDLVGRHFSTFRRQRETMRELAYNHNMSLRTMERRESLVTGYLNDLWDSVEAKSCELFVECGLLT